MTHIIYLKNLDARHFILHTMFSLSTYPSLVSPQQNRQQNATKLSTKLIFFCAASFSPALGNTFTHSNYATIGELVTAFNNIYGSDSFFASSGLFYDFLPMSYYIPNTTIFEEFNSLFSSPADAIYRAVSGIDGRDDTPIANNTNYSVSDYATIDDFVAQINTDYSSIIDASVPTSGNGNASPTTINSQADQDFLNFGDSVTLFTTEVTK